MKFSIILPTYNEKDGIVEFVDTLVKVLNQNSIDFEVIVVDDNSPDGTGELLKTRYRNDSRISCVIRKDERGLATALKTGISYSKGEGIILMDSDFNHDPYKIPEMVRLISEYDIVSGSRYVRGGGITGPQYRYWGSYVFNYFVRLVTMMKTKDNLSGFVVFRKKILENFDLGKIFVGYGDYYMRFLYRAKKLKLRVIEIPVLYGLRRGGTSKTEFSKHLVDYFITVFKIKINR